MEKKIPEKKVVMKEDDVFYVYEKRINKCIKEDCEGVVKYGLIVKVKVGEEESINCFECNKCHMKYTPYPNFYRLENKELSSIYNKEEVDEWQARTLKKVTTRKAAEEKAKRASNRFGSKRSFNNKNAYYKKDGYRSQDGYRGKNDSYRNSENYHSGDSYRSRSEGYRSNDNFRSHNENYYARNDGYRNNDSHHNRDGYRRGDGFHNQDAYRSDYQKPYNKPYARRNEEGGYYQRNHTAKTYTVKKGNIFITGTGSQNFQQKRKTTEGNFSDRRPSYSKKRPEQHDASHESTE